MHGLICLYNYILLTSICLRTRAILASKTPPDIISHASINTEVTGTLSKIRDSPLNVQMELFHHWGRLRLGNSSYSRNPNVVSGLRCARSITRVIQPNSTDRDRGHKTPYVNK